MKISNFSVIKSNVLYYKFRTIVLIVVMLLLSFSIVFADSLKNSFRVSIDKVDNMLGADIIIAPSGVNSELQESLFVGKPSSFVFESKYLNGVSEIDSIDTISTELLLATFNADCCDTEVQMVSIEFNTDHAISVWLENEIKVLNENEIIVGSDIAYEIGQGAKFFDTNFKVVGKLKKTGMGYDNSVFVNTTTGKKLARVSESTTNDVISMALIKVKEKQDIDTTCELISDIITDKSISVYKTNYLYTQINNEILHMSFLIDLFIIIIVCLFCCAFVSIVLLTTNERKKEFSTYLLIGYSELQRILIFASEFVILVVIGTLNGFFLSILFVFLFKNYMTLHFSVPIEISILAMSITYIKVLFFTLIVCGVSVFLMYLKLRKNDYNYIKM